MKAEELLYPRYKVINIWPGMHLEPFGKDQIVVLQPHKEEDAEGFVYRPNKHKPRDFMWQSFFDLFPHLFQRLEWWEGRDVSEMPEYLNCPSRKMFFKVERWHKSYFIIDGRQKMQYRNYIPATLEQYTAYINQQH